MPIDATAGRTLSDGALLSLDTTAQARMAHTFVTLRPQQTAPGTAERILTLQDVGWAESEVEEFLRTCGQEMDCYGYTLDATYRRSTPVIG